MSIVTISKEFACDTELFAGELAVKLGYAVFEKTLGVEAADGREALLRDREQSKIRSSSRLLDFLNKYTTSTIRGVVDRSYRRVDEKAYYKLTSALVLHAAQQNNVIILGWGGQCILKDHSRTVHLRIVKSLEDRVAWLKLSGGLDEKDARDLIEREESESAGYIRHYFGQAWDDPHLYHIILNLSKLSLEQAVNMVLSLVQQQSRY